MKTHRLGRSAPPCMARNTAASALLVLCAEIATVTLKIARRVDPEGSTCTILASGECSRCESDVQCSASRLPDMWEGCVRRVGRTVEGYNSRDDLDRLVVRDIVRLSLCKETSPLNSLSGDGSKSSANTASFSPREQILTFFRLQVLAFIVRDLRSFRLLLPILLLTPGVALSLRIKEFR